MRFKLLRPKKCPNISDLYVISVISYCLRHGLHIRENLRFLGRGMGFSKNLYASVLKAPSRN